MWTLIAVALLCAGPARAGERDEPGPGLAVSPRTAAALKAWVPFVAGTTPPLADSMARVPRDAPAEGTLTANVFAARGDMEGFSIVVQAPADASITRLSATASALVGPGGKAIPSDHLEIYRALYQKIDAPSGRGDPPRSPSMLSRLVSRSPPGASYRPRRPDGPPGSGTSSDPGNGSMCGRGRPFGPPPCFIPDGLVPYKRCSDGSAPPCPGDEGTPLTCPVDGTGCGDDPPGMVVAALQNQQLWVEVSVPRGAERCPPGTYRGTITVSADTGTATIELALHVWDFELPRSPSFRTAFGSNTAPPGKSPPHGWVVSEQDYLAKHRVSSVRYGARPGDTGGYRRAWRRLLGPLGVPNAVAAPFWPGVALGICSRKAEGRSYPRAAAIEAWLRSQQVPSGVMVYVYDGDEVFKEFQAPCAGSLYAEMRAGGRVAHSAGAKVLSVVNPIAELSYENEDGSGRPAVDIFVASPKEMFRESTRNGNYHGPDIVERVTRSGSELWTYNIWLQNSWGPKWMLDYSPVAYRLGFISQALGISGALVAEYWTKAQAHENPWVNGVFSFARGGDSRSGPMNGDSQFIYPGAPVGLGRTPTAHLRLKMFRDGIDDYDLIQILKNISGGAGYTSGACPGFTVTCKALVGALGGTDYSDYSTDTHALQRARKAIGDRVASDPNRPRM
jgi:hypothetical protein